MPPTSQLVIIPGEQYTFMQASFAFHSSYSRDGAEGSPPAVSIGGKQRATKDLDIVRNNWL